MQNRLKQFRELHNLTPRQMAQAMRISESSYYKVEGGQRQPTYGFIKKFKEVFRASVDEIFF